jgi:small subunit ribosomal protein S8
MSDPIADMLTRIRNAQRALQPAVRMPHTRLREAIARVLAEEGFVAAATVEPDPATGRRALKLQLKYAGRKAAIEGLRRASSPGRRHYVGSDEIPRVLNGMGISIVSTSRGVMTGENARRQNVGGELLCTVW